MNAPVPLPDTAQQNVRPDHDVLIVGAGISGISMAAHLQMLSPERDYAIVERRDHLGGTWDLFRYPGVRSDSDMHSLGFRFEPWVDDKSIADGDAILAYLDKVVDDRGIRDKISFGTIVLGANWISRKALWKVLLETNGERRVVTARVLYLGAGYYDYDTPYDPGFPGREDFAGQVVHPQFWPRDLDYAGKRVVVIGSGATAVTIVPAMAETAAHVTMLQRTPTWIAARPARDAIANALRALLPGKLAYKLTRAKNIGLHSFFYKRMRARPAKAAAFLSKQARKALGPAWSDKDFVPPYNPWEQRLCLVPDGDLFEAVRGGRASVVTGAIERFEKDGVRLASGELVPADVIVTATGLELTLAGKIGVTIDGEPVGFQQRFFYRSAMFSNVPNLFGVFGYLNASWTLRADNTAQYACNVLNLMRDKHAAVVTPVLPDGHTLIDDDIYATFSSGYLARVKHLMPRNADRLPWRLNMDYFEDRKDFRERPVDDGVLKFEPAPITAPQPA
jgi:cation diffusion facilitator CzcD-associated flavoprotein CzcO